MIEAFTFDRRDLGGPVSTWSKLSAMNSDYLPRPWTTPGSMRGCARGDFG